MGSQWFGIHRKLETFTLIMSPTKWVLAMKKGKKEKEKSLKMERKQGVVGFGI